MRDNSLYETLQTADDALSMIQAAAVKGVPHGMDLNNVRAIIARAMSTAVASSERTECERAWLIELYRGVMLYFYLAHDHDWTPDARKALRFARREDAQAYIDHIGWTDPKPVSDAGMFADVGTSTLAPALSGAPPADGNRT